MITLFWYVVYEISSYIVYLGTTVEDYASVKYYDRINNG